MKIPGLSFSLKEQWALADSKQKSPAKLVFQPPSRAWNAKLEGQY